MRIADEGAEATAAAVVAMVAMAAMALNVITHPQGGGAWSPLFILHISKTTATRA